MSLTPYPEYKDSGVEWVGDIPAHWEIRPFFSIAKLNRRSNRGLIEKNLKSLSYGRIVSKDINANDGLLPESFETYQVIEPGDIVFRLTDLQNDKRSLRSAIVRERGIITSAYLSVRLEDCLPIFFSYVMRDADLRKVFYSMGGGLRQSMKYDDMKWLGVVFPPKAEQHEIVVFLDRETAEIDAFITDQEQLISLLSERRTATITHAVTKGLNPHAPMRDSETEWLGEVPESWSVGLCKHTSTISLGKMLQPAPRSKADEEAPYLRAANVQPLGRLDLTSKKSMWFSTSELKKLDLLRGDVVIVEGGVGGYGRAAYLSDNLVGWSFQNSIVRLRPRIGFSGKFLTYAFLHLRTAGYISMTASVSSMPHFTAEKVEATTLAWPNTDEQQAIAAYLDQETAKVDAAIADAQEAVTLSKERRAALISAAVTGKIDVRGQGAPASMGEAVSIGVA